MSELLREGLTEFETPEAHGFLADDYTAFRQQFLDFAKAEAEAVIEPDGMVDYFSRESMILIETRAMGTHAPVTEYRATALQGHR